MIAAAFAHQGGWDEILFVAVPILLFGALLVVANRRASRVSTGRRGEEPHGTNH